MRGPATILVCLALGCATAPERPPAGTAVSTAAPDAGADAATASTGTPAAFGEVDALLAQSLPTWGGGVLRVERDDAVIFERAYGGYAPADAVPIASATKLLSTLVILSLVRDGFLTLETPAGSLLPGWPKDKAAITLRMLLAQTSGLPRGPTASRHGPGRCPPAPRRSPGCRSALRRARRSSTAAPGSRWPAAWPSSPRGSRGRSCRRPG